MAALNPRPQSPAAGRYTPDQDDIDEFAAVRAVHDVLDLCPSLPLETRLALLDHVAAVLAGRSPTSRREAVHG